MQTLGSMIERFREASRKPEPAPDPRPPVERQEYTLVIDDVIFVTPEGEPSNISIANEPLAAEDAAETIATEPDPPEEEEK
jgi:hypothetical protein